MGTRFLDVSDLPAPEPFSAIMEALSALREEDVLEVRHRRQPLLLYQPLRDLGFSFHVQQRGPDAFDIFIWRQGHAAPVGLRYPNLAATPES